MSLVHVQPAIEREDFASAELAEQNCSFVANNGGLGEPGNVAERYSHRIGNFFCEPAEAGAKNDSDGWLMRARAQANRIRCGLCRFRRVSHQAAPPPLPSTGPSNSSMLSETSSISIRRSSHGRNALSKPLSAIPASSSTVNTRCCAAKTYSSVRVVALVNRLSVLSVTLRPRSKYSRTGCVA